MEVIKTIEVVRKNLQQHRQFGRSIALVPTMGALHDGHLSLIRIAREHCDIVAVSIFVNALQFNSASDLESYPRTLQSDCDRCFSAGVDLVFAPGHTEIYPDVSSAANCRIVAGDRSFGLCGGSRQGHFDGVVTVVGILFNIIQPDAAVFGEKDFQQLRVIEQMVRDLHFPVRIVRGAIVRDSDSLALSSRNQLLTADDRYHALYIPQTLNKAREMVLSGHSDVKSLKEVAKDNLLKSGGITIDYIEIVDRNTLAPITDRIKKRAQLLVAAYVGKVRLIDNILLELP